MTIHVLHEDARLLAVSKPSGQLVIPGRGDLPGEPLLAKLERNAGKKIYVVHRLDRGASGIVLFAKDPKTHKTLCEQFEKRQVLKTYLVLAQGLVKENGTVDQPLRSFGSGRIGIHPQGKPSSTEYWIHQHLRGATLLDVLPSTGRRHQIRVHLYSIGHPVMGDTLYGQERPVGGAPRLMLHAWKIEFTHPNGQRVALTAEAPQDFQNVLDSLRL